MNTAVQDQNRINDISRLKLQQPITDEVIDSYVNKATEELHLPVGFVSILLDGTHHFTLSEAHTTETSENPMIWLSTADAIASKEPVVMDELNEEIGCYAGVPLTTKNGYVIGNLCVVGMDHHSFTKEEIDKLEDYAAMVMMRLEERVAA